MTAPEPRPGFPLDNPGLPHDDPVVLALVAHQRHTVSHCLCGWSVLGASHAEHVAGILRPLIEAELREQIVQDIAARQLWEAPA